MATSDDGNKTKSQLLAEIEELRSQLAARQEAVSADANEAPLQPVLAAPMTRRTALSTWVAPVILSIPFGVMARPRTAQALPAPALPTVPPTVPPTGGTPALPTSAPTMIPTPIPTSIPTSFPTAFPTAFPTSFPTAAPTDTPTLTPTETPDAAATAAAGATQTAAAAATQTARAGIAAPAPALSEVGLGAAVTVLAGAGVWRLLKKRTEGLDGDDGKPEESDEDSGNEGGTK
jgi:hypothetical protein